MYPVAATAPVPVMDSGYGPLGCSARGDAGHGAIHTVTLLSTLRVL